MTKKLKELLEHYRMIREVHRLGDIIEYNDSSWTKKLGWDTLNYLDTANITKGVIDEIVQFDPSTDKVPSRARRLVKAGDIIYSTVRPNQRHYGVLSEVPHNLNN